MLIIHKYVMMLKGELRFTEITKKINRPLSRKI